MTGVIVPVAPEVRGRVVNVYVTDNQHVEAGAALLDIFPQDYADAEKERSQAVSTLTAEQIELQASLTQREKGARPGAGQPHCRGRGGEDLAEKN